MSDKKQRYIAAGVFKIDYKSAGYPDLVKIAREWAKDPSFYELIVRGVSERNFGIQFVYISDEPENSNIKKYKQELIEKYARGEGGLYAWDYHEDSWELDEEPMHFDASNSKEDMIVVMKGFTK